MLLFLYLYSLCVLSAAILVPYFGFFEVLVTAHSMLWCSSLGWAWVVRKLYHFVRHGSIVCIVLWRLWLKYNLDVVDGMTK